MTRGWANDPNGGLGKSTLARQLIGRGELRLKGRLAAAIFLSLVDSKGLEGFVRLIGGETGLVHEMVVAMVVEAIEHCYSAALSSHIEIIIRDPLLALQRPQPLIAFTVGVHEWNPHDNFVDQLSVLEPFTSSIRLIILGQSASGLREGWYKSASIGSRELAPMSTKYLAGHLSNRSDTMTWKDGGRATIEDVLKVAVSADGSFIQMEEVVWVVRDLPASYYEDISKPIFAMAMSGWDSVKLSCSVEELDRTVLLDRVALGLRPSGHPKRLNALHNLGASVGERYKKSKSADDLQEAILLDRAALALRPPDDPYRYLSCYNLACSLHDRFRKDGLVGDLEEAIILGKEALSLCPEGHEDRHITVSNQRLCIYERFQIKGAVEDLREAITLAEEALVICPKDHPQYPCLPAWISSHRHQLDKIMAKSGEGVCS